jgi:hypothetical protein
VVTACRFAKIAGFRNLLAHDYEKVDPKYICEGILSRLPDIDTFLRQIAQAVSYYKSDYDSAKVLFPLFTQEKNGMWSLSDSVIGPVDGHHENRNGHIRISWYNNLR